MCTTSRSTNNTSCISWVAARSCCLEATRESCSSRRALLLCLLSARAVGEVLWQGVHNYGKGVQIAGPNLYFLSGKGQIVKIDLPLLIRCAENRRTYRSETMPSGTVVDLVAPEKDRILSISAIGVVSIIESGRVVKQTARLSDKDVFTCIAEIDEKILVVCGNELNKTSTLRLLGPDLRDIYQHLQEQESKS